MHKQNWQQQSDMLRGYSGRHNQLTQSIEEILKVYYLEPNPHYGNHDLNERNYRRSIKVIRDSYTAFTEDIDVMDMFHFSDDTELNTELVKQFWEAFLQKHYYDNIGYETYDMFLTVLEAQLREKLPVYNKIIAGAFEDMWKSYVQENESTADSAVQSNTEQSNESNSSANSLAKNQSSFTDTPQTMMNISGSNPQYASNLNGSEGTSESNGNETGSGKSKSLSDSQTNGKTKSWGTNMSRIDFAKKFMTTDQFLNLGDKIVRDGELFSRVQNVDLYSSRNYGERHGGRRNILQPFNGWRI